MICAANKHHVCILASGVAPCQAKGLFKVAKKGQWELEQYLQIAVVMYRPTITFRVREL